MYDKDFIFASMIKICSLGAVNVSLIFRERTFSALVDTDKHFQRDHVNLPACQSFLRVPVALEFCQHDLLSPDYFSHSREQVVVSCEFEFPIHC